MALLSLCLSCVLVLPLLSCTKVFLLSSCRGGQARSYPFGTSCAANQAKSPVATVLILVGCSLGWSLLADLVLGLIRHWARMEPSLLEDLVYILSGKRGMYLIWQCERERGLFTLWIPSPKCTWILIAELPVKSGHDSFAVQVGFIESKGAILLCVPLVRMYVPLCNVLLVVILDLPPLPVTHGVNSKSQY